jgi:GT2 family glycosyltransferase
MAQTVTKELDLSIIIVSYNSLDVTIACLASLFRHPPSVRFEVILIDNASPDGSARAIAKGFPQVRLISSDVNYGFAQGNNVAAVGAKGRRLLLLNPDTLIFPDSFDALWAFAERSPQRRIWGGRTLFADGSLNIGSCWANITVWSLVCSAMGLVRLFPRSNVFNPETMPGWLRDSEREVDLVCGCFFLIDHGLWLELDGFDPLFFMYAEEAGLCLRARARGARPAITPEATIIHLGGASEASQVDKVIKTVRGRITLIRKHWSPSRVAVARSLYLLWAFTRYIGANFMSGPRDLPSQSVEKWRAIWRRRNEWIDGY